MIRLLFALVAVVTGDVAWRNRWAWVRIKPIKDLDGPDR